MQTKASEQQYPSSAGSVGGIGHHRFYDPLHQLTGAAALDLRKKSAGAMNVVDPRLTAAGLYPPFLPMGFFSSHFVPGGNYDPGLLTGGAASNNFAAMFPNFFLFNNGLLPNFYSMPDFQTRFECLLAQYRTPPLPPPPQLPPPPPLPSTLVNVKVEPHGNNQLTSPSYNVPQLPPVTIKQSLKAKRERHSPKSTFESESEYDWATTKKSLLTTNLNRPAKSASVSSANNNGQHHRRHRQNNRTRSASTVPRDCDDADNGQTKFQDGVTVGYTYDALFISDGRSKRRVNPVSPKDHQRYTCNVCQKSYATSSNLSRHKQTHRPLDSNFAKKCAECGKVYVSMPALSMHLLTHKLEHKCDTCGKAFSRPWLLQGHKRSHSGSKPYGCLHCGKAFADRSNLRAHMQTHSGLKRYVCVKCGKKFALKSYLNKHTESACTKDCRSDTGSPVFDHFAGDEDDDDDEQCASSSPVIVDDDCGDSIL